RDAWLGTRLGRLLRRRAGLLLRRPPRRGAGFAAAALLIAGFTGYGVIRGGHGAAVAEELAGFRDKVANLLGFRITSIVLAGGKHITREEILTVSGVTGRTSLLFLDAAAARARLKSNPWVADATVLKLYPGRLRIDVTERNAFALWQKDGKVAVIAQDGTIVESFVSRPFVDLPLVVGQGADTRAKDFLATLERYPALRPQVRAEIG